MNSIVHSPIAIPPPPQNKRGWPWTFALEPLPPTMPNGSPWPKVSVVTPSYNQADFLEETIRSVLLQGYPNLEYIIIDGGSTDNSVEIIKKYEKWLAYWVSEKDRGQSHAISKGLAQLTGSIFNYINSDDFLTPNALAHVATLLHDCDLVAGAVHVVDADSQKFDLWQNKNLNSKYLLVNPGIVQPAIWMWTEHVHSVGGVNPELQCVFDWELVVRYLYRYSVVKYTDKPLAAFRLHSTSKTSTQARMFIEEQLLVGKRIAQNAEIKELHASSKSLIRKMEWRLFLLDIPDDRESGLVKAARVLIEGMKDPFNRLTRGKGAWTGIKSSLFRN